MPVFEIRIEYLGTVSTITAAHTEFLLDAAARHGLWLPRVCCQGWCTTCAARITAGRAEHTAARRFYDQDAAAGFALLCTARPLSAMTVIAGQHEALRDHRVRHGLPVPRA